MLEDAEKYASVDKEKRGNVDLKNQAEALCFEVEKEFSLLKNNLSEDKQQNISELIQTIKQTIQNEDYKLLESQIEELKQIVQDFTVLKQN
jgi:molecular chaperone DnaK